MVVGKQIGTNVASVIFIEKTCFLIGFILNLNLYFPDMLR